MSGEETERGGEQSIMIQNFYTLLNLWPLALVKSGLMFTGVCYTLKVLLEIGTTQVEVEKSRYQSKIVMPMLPQKEGRRKYSLLSVLIAILLSHQLPTATLVSISTPDGRCPVAWVIYASRANNFVRARVRQWIWNLSPVNSSQGGPTRHFGFT